MNEMVQKKIDEYLRSLFAKSIKQSFLIRMKYKALELLGDKVNTFFTAQRVPEDLALNEFFIEYEICKLIVGVHRSNIVFLTDDEKAKKEKDSSYCEQLAKDVIANLKLRDYAGAFFRKSPLLSGESFIYYPLPYHLFAVSTQINNILLAHPETSEFRPLLVQMNNKGLAALSLLEDNLLGSAYPICRSAIELFIKTFLLTMVPQVINDYYKFEDFAVQNSYGERTYQQEFNKLYKNRKNQKEHNKIEYLHFGWVDGIADYHAIVRQKPYTINGIQTYLRNKDDEDDPSLFDTFEKLFKMCHGYAHGNIFQLRYPLMQYLEISIMLCYVLTNTYKMVCDHYDEPYTINGVEILTLIDRDWAHVRNQYDLCNVENLNAYYKRKQ
ncbi:MAG: hypothetical protein K2M89_00015 [Clostridiales bacterium]|nr:hypothetical protein [Clostridiales bacterium]